MKAMILGAGLSTRMRPITNNIPKPLVSFFDKNLLYYQVAYLKSHGFDDVAVNTHYFAEQFSDYNKQHPSHSVTLFHEDNIRGTGGGICGMQSFIDNQDNFAVINCDFISNIDLAKNYVQHKKTKAIASMLLCQSREPYANVYYNSNTLDIHSIAPQETPQNKDISFGHFSGIHFFHKTIFDFMPTDKHFFCINRDVYRSLIQQKQNVKIIENMQSHWVDIGESKYYYPSHMFCLNNIIDFPWIKHDLSNSGYDYVSNENTNNSYIHQSNEINPKLKIQNAFIGPACDFKNTEVISNSILLGQNCFEQNNIDIKNKLFLRRSNLSNSNQDNFFYKAL